MKRNGSERAAAMLESLPAEDEFSPPPVGQRGKTRPEVTTNFLLPPVTVSEEVVERHRTVARIDRIFHAITCSCFKTKMSVAYSANLCAPAPSKEAQQSVGVSDNAASLIRRERAKDYVPPYWCGRLIQRYHS